MIKEKLGDLGTGVIEVSWHLIIRSMRLGHKLSTQGFLAVYTKLDFDALKERIKLLIFSAWTGIKTIFHGDDRGARTGTSSLKSLCIAELSNIPATNNRWPQSHCLLHKPPLTQDGVSASCPRRTERWDRHIPGQKHFQFQHQIAKIPVPDVLTSINGQIVLEHHGISNLEKVRGG